MSELVELLRDEPVFGCLSEEARQKLAQLARRRDFEKDETVCLQGEAWAHVLYIAEGGLRSVMSAPDGRSFVGATWEPGNVFWAPTVFDNGPVPSSLEAVTKSRAYEWSGEQVLEAVLATPNAIRALLRQQTIIIRQRRQGIFNLAFNPLASRLAHLLIDKVFVSGEPTVQRDLTLADMAEMIASSPEVVCRLLYQLQSTGAISINRASITLHDREALERLVVRD